MNKVNKVFDIKPADRISSTQEYYFSTKLKEIANLRAQGKNIINLGVGSPDLPPSNQAREVFVKDILRNDSHGYQSYIGIPELRQAFSKWYQQWYGVTLDPNSEILPLIGSKEGVTHISNAFLNQGDHVLVPDPGYPAYAAVTKLAGATPITYQLTPANNWEPDWKQIEQLDLDKIKIMWVNYPHMPTGKNASVKLFEEIIAFGLKHSILICHDNPYSFILNDQPLSILSIPDAKHVAIELNSMSKAHNMPGWRIGMLASNPQFVQWVLTVKSNVDSGQLHALQLAAAEALNAGQDWYDQINSVYRQRRKVAEQIMTAIGCTFDSTQVGLFLWGKIQNESIDAEQLCDQILYNADVFVTPGFIFGSEGKQFVRISLCCEEKILLEALQRIQQSNITFSDGRCQIKSDMTQPSIPLCEHVRSGVSTKPTSGSPVLHSTKYQIN